MISEADSTLILPTVVEVYLESFKRAKSMSKLDKCLAKLLLDFNSLVSESRADSFPSITCVLLSTLDKVSSALAMKASVSKSSTFFWTGKSGLMKDIKVSLIPWPSDKEFPKSSDIPFVFIKSEDNLPV